MQVINEVREVEFILFRSGSLTYNVLQACAAPHEYKTIFGGGNTKTKMRSIYLNLAEAKK
jgi:hypothetical protein